MSLTRALGAAAVLALALTVFGCGGGSGGGDADQIKAVIEADATTKDPNNCVERQTQRYTEQTEFGQGTDAVNSCEGSTTEVDAKSVDVSAIEVSGGKAAAEVAFHGAGFDGQSVKVSLLKQDGKWKLDHIDGFTHFDKGKFLAAFLQAASLGQNSTTAKQASCLTDSLGKLPDDQLEKLFLSGDPNSFVSLLAPCLR